MILAVQVQVMLYDILVGWGYGVIACFFTRLELHCKHRFIQLVWEIFFHGLYALGYYAGKLMLNDGIYSIYDGFFFLFGFLFYSLFYHPFFSSRFSHLFTRIEPIHQKVLLVKNKFLVIIRLQTKRKKGTRICKKD